MFFFFALIIVCWLKIFAKKKGIPKGLLSQESSSDILTYKSTSVTVVAVGGIFAWKELILLVEYVPEQTAM